MGIVGSYYTNMLKHKFEELLNGSDKKRQSIVSCVNLSAYHRSYNKNLIIAKAPHRIFIGVYQKLQCLHKNGV